MRRLLLLSIVIVLAACHKPREIPDDKLIAIVGELFLSNAAWTTGVMPDSLRRDTVDLYGPVFKRYGYRPEDFTYTIRTLSKRKSIRLTDLIDRSIEHLEKQGEGIFARVTAQDTLEQIAARLFRKEVYTDSLRRLSRISDPEDKPDISLPLEEGRYEVSFVYLIDTADKNPYVQYMQYVTDTAGRRSQYTYRSFPKGHPRRETISLDITDTLRYKTLDIILAYSGSKNKEKPHISIDSLRVERFLPKALAQDCLSRRILSPALLPIFPRTLLDSPNPDDHASTAQDLIPFRLDSARVDTPADSLLRSRGEAR